MKTIFCNEKKAWIRIVEAVLAILIIASVSMYLYNKQAKKPDIEEAVYSLQKSLLNEISTNDEFREQILNNNKTQIDGFISERMPENLNFRTKICEPSDVCGMDEYIGRDTYTREILITATLQQYKPKKFKIFIWEK